MIYKRLQNPSIDEVQTPQWPKGQTMIYKRLHRKLKIVRYDFDSVSMMFWWDLETVSTVWYFCVFHSIDQLNQTTKILFVSMTTSRQQHLCIWVFNSTSTYQFGDKLQHIILRICYIRYSLSWAGIEHTTFLHNLFTHTGVQYALHIGWCSC
jgi:hypothetical protein